LKRAPNAAAIYAKAKDDAEKAVEVSRLELAKHDRKRADHAAQ
jgi:hypothetical protein